MPNDEASSAQDHPTYGEVELNTANLKLIRTIGHQVLSPKAPNEPQSPILTNKVQAMDRPLEALVAKRIVKSVDSRAKTFAIKFNEYGPGTFFPIAVEALKAASNRQFVKKSQELAELLGEQHTRSVPEGLLIVIQARVANRPALVLVKADKQDGIAGTVDAAANTVFALITDLFLTTGSKLHKVVVLVQTSDSLEPDGFQAILYDGTIKKRADIVAAQYFIQDFLGAEIAREGRRDTFTFYEAAREVITSTIPVIDEQITALRALDVYMLGPTDIFTIEEFVTSVIPQEHQEDVEEALRESKAPSGGIAKDTSDLKRRLQSTPIELSNGVKLLVPHGLTGENISFRSEGSRLTIEILGLEDATNE